MSISGTNVEDTPSTGVVFLWLRQTIDGQEFTFKCQGWDHYFLKEEEEEDGVRFGGWLDPDSPYGTGGREFFWRNGENFQTMTPITGQPTDIAEQDIKHGVLVPKPDSEELGLE